MEGSREAYDDLVRRYAEQVPELIAQVQDEVARGRRIDGSKLPSDERAAREERIKEVKAGRRIGKNEQAVISYSDDERLLLLAEAVARGIQVATALRRQLAGFASSHELSPEIFFSSPDETVPDTRSIGTLQGEVDQESATEAQTELEREIRLGRDDAR